MEPRVPQGIVIGVDLGGTKILSSGFGADGSVIGRDKRPTMRELGPGGVTQRIGDSVLAALAAGGRSLDEVIAIGIGAPGPLDPDTGVILTTPNLGWTDFPLARSVSELLSKPVWIDNDVKLAALGEARRGAGVGAASLVGLWFGTGVGGALIIDGKLHHGASKNAAEIGHHTVVAGGPMCGCGVRGHLEAVASRSAVESGLRRAIAKGKKTSLAKALAPKHAQLKGGLLLKAYKKGDKQVIKQVHSVAEFAGIGVANMLNILGPERVVLGGGVIESFEHIILDRIKDSARRHCFAIAYNSAEIVVAKLGESAGVVGAAEHAIDKLGS